MSPFGVPEYWLNWGLLEHLAEHTNGASATLSTT